ncbi:hypothetical protein FH972_011173 [Carpinus fangiana]|uniref:Uncharacterized protein n=1 Tax=Carpinus fangiana TaxID=176857 RepID=A0A660KSC6_9ROSI|nr:hypothetical protein FH972_011173 [Carpinus fangiana]
MSFTSCLLVLLLCFSLHACNARHLPAADDHKRLEKSDHEKTGSDKISALSKVQAFFSKQNVDSTQKGKETKTNQKTYKSEGKTSSDAVETESLVSVSWHVPHKEHSEKNPGFNLDYSPPKTHPPSHN